MLISTMPLPARTAASEAISQVNDSGDSLPNNIMQRWTVNTGTVGRTISGTAQEISLDLSFEVTLYHTLYPERAKWVKIKALGAGFNPGELASNTDSDRGYYIEDFALSFEPEHFEGGLPTDVVLHATAPATQQEGGSYTRETGFDVGIDISGPSYTFNQSEAETLHVKDFRILNQAAGKKAAWNFQLRRVGTGTVYNDWKDMRDFGVHTGLQPELRTLPGQAVSTLQPGVEAVYRVPDGFHKPILFDLATQVTLRRINRDGSNYIARIHQLHNRHPVLVDFGAVNYDGDLRAEELAFSIPDPDQRQQIALRAHITRQRYQAQYEDVEVIFYRGPCRDTAQSVEIGRTTVDVVRPSLYGKTELIWDSSSSAAQGEQLIWYRVTPQPGETNQENNVICRSIDTSSRVIYVDAGASGANDGSSWDDAYTDLQSALRVARDHFGVAIWLAEGVYKPTRNNDRQFAFVVPDGTLIYGGFPAGGGGGSFAARDPAAYSTVLSGDIGVAGRPEDNSYNIVFMEEVGRGTLLDGLTLSGGYADAGNSLNGVRSRCGDEGGGICVAYNRQIGPRLHNLIIEDNYAAWSGGGFYGRGELHNVVFRNNRAGKFGGGFAGRGKMRNNVFRDNQAGEMGGGASIQYDSDVAGAVFTANRAPQGSAFSSYASTIANVTVSNNVGNAVYSQGADTIANSIIWNNQGVPVSLSPQSVSNVKLHNNIIQGLSLQTGIHNIDPLFVAPDDLRLRPESPAIDAGDNSLLPADLNYDLAGNPRLVGSDGPAIVDIGAYEAVPSVVEVFVGERILREGGQGITLTASLSSRPVADVVVEIAADEGLRIEPARLSFTPQNWQTPQEVRVVAVDDNQLQRTRQATLRYRVLSADPLYDGITVPADDLSIQDDERASVNISQRKLDFEVGTVADYQLALSSAPVDEVVVEVLAPQGIDVQPASLTFTAENWNRPQTVSVLAAEQTSAVSGTIRHRVISGDPAYQQISLSEIAVQLSVPSPDAERVYLPLVIR